MTTGKLPYDEKGSALLFAPLRSDPIPPSLRAARYPQELEDLILRLLARQPDARPPDAFAVQDALGKLLGIEADDHPPAIATPPPPTPLEYGAEQGRDPRRAAGTAPADPALVRPPATGAGVLVGAARWSEALVELETAIAAARRRNAPAQRVERAAELAALVRLNVMSLERVSRAVVAEQRRVDALEAEGRSFRDSIGRALDELALDRSRARAHRDAARDRLAAMTGDAPRSAPPMPCSGRVPPSRSRAGRPRSSSKTSSFRSRSSSRASTSGTSRWSRTSSRRAALSRARWRPSVTSRASSTASPARRTSCSATRATDRPALRSSPRAGRHPRATRCELQRPGA